MTLAHLTLSQIAERVGSCTCGAFGKPDVSDDLVKVAKIKALVATAFGVTVSEIEGTRRQARIVTARQAAIRLAWNHADLTLSGLARCLGMTHSNVKHSVDAAFERMRTDPAFRALVEGVEAGL